MPTIISSRHYRYPGSAPFQDTETDRRLFFGRELEIQTLLHTILAERLVVVFAKSGIGKTSLLNAGVLEALRNLEFLPISIRFNDEKQSPLDAVFTGITKTIEDFHIEKHPSLERVDDDSITHYFETAEFWTTREKPWKKPNVLLTPVLLLDQFEEFFFSHSIDVRQAFIEQLAVIVKSSIKVIIAIREDHLAQLEELALDIPEILQNRYRLLPLQREQARQAIIKPASLTDAEFATSAFEYAPELIDMILDFLSTLRKHEKSVSTNEIEPFQLQILCQHIEAFALQNRKTMIQPGDLGGERGMYQVLQNFYHYQMAHIFSPHSRHRVRKLCEQGLISTSGRKLILEEEEIERKFRVSPQLLEKLVYSRLLRRDTRFDTTYYELSHDTLIAPIRDSHRIAQRKRRLCFGIVSSIVLIGITLLSVYFLHHQQRKEQEKEQLLQETLQNISQNNFTKANEQVRQILDKYPHDAFVQTSLSKSYKNAGQLLSANRNYQEAIGFYQKAIEIAPNDSEAYGTLAFLFMRIGDYKNARISIEKALQFSESDANTYSMWYKNSLIQVYYELNDYQIADGLCQKMHATLQSKANCAKVSLAVGNFEHAEKDARYAIKRSWSIQSKFDMQFVIAAALFFQQKESDAFIELNQLIMWYKCLEGLEAPTKSPGTRYLLETGTTLSETNKTILLKTLDLLETPYSESQSLTNEINQMLSDAFKASNSIQEN